jgi:hypothetical protein
MLKLFLSFNKFHNTQMQEEAEATVEWSSAGAVLRRSAVRTQ